MSRNQDRTFAGGGSGGGGSSDPTQVEYNGTRYDAPVIAFQGEGAPLLIASVEEVPPEFGGPAAVVNLKEVVTLDTQQEITAGKIFSGLVDGANTVEFHATDAEWPVLGFKHNAGEIDEAQGDLYFDPVADRIGTNGPFEAFGGIYDGADRVYSASNPPPAAGSAFVGARVKNASAQSISGWTSLTFPTDVIDTDGFHADTGNPQRFTVPGGGTYDGVYEVSATVRFASGSAGELAAYIDVNGSQASDVVSISRAVDYGQSLQIREIVDLVGGDIVMFNALGGDTASATARIVKL